MQGFGTFAFLAQIQRLVDQQFATWAPFFNQSERAILVEKVLTRHPWTCELHQKQSKSSVLGRN